MRLRCHFAWILIAIWQNVAAAKLQAHWRGKNQRMRMKVNPSSVKTVDMLLLRRAVELQRRERAQHETATQRAAPPPAQAPSVRELNRDCAPLELGMRLCAPRLSWPRRRVLLATTVFEDT